MARLLFAHAHPDDESLWTGVTMAHHVARGDEVHVLTCTLGEEGEVIPDDLKHLELPAGSARPDDVADELAPVRREELRRAMTAMRASPSCTSTTTPPALRSSTAGRRRCGPEVGAG